MKTFHGQQKTLTKMGKADRKAGDTLKLHLRTIRRFSKTRIIREPSNGNADACACPTVESWSTANRFFGVDNVGK